MPAVAVMQPYLFPYIGYFHLIQAVKYFVVLDDVHLPGRGGRGFVNRNRLLVNGVPKWFTVPVRNDRLDTPLSQREYLLDDAWCSKLLRTLRTNYSAENREAAERLVAHLKPEKHSDRSVVAVNLSLLILTMDEIGIQRPVVLRSSNIAPKANDPTDRLVRICTELGGTEYVNLPGGRALYSELRFREAGVRLGFIDPQPEPYPQRSERFVPWMSILDLIASTKTKQRSAALSAYSIEFCDSRESHRPEHD